LFRIKPRREPMTLSNYFEKGKGKGVIATADEKGKVGMAVYARPHFINEKTVAFIMADRLMHKNLQSNPSASYLFVEERPGYKGKRLYLTKIKEEENSELVDQLRRRGCCPVDEGYKRGQRFVVFFRVNKVLPLIGEKK
jgi:hypothetical protein